MKKIVLLLILIFIVSGCGCTILRCSKGYTYNKELNRCEKITTREAKFEYYCKEDRTLEGTKCVYEIIKDPEIKYECPNGYYMFGNECRIGVVDTRVCQANEGYLNGECYPNTERMINYICDVQSELVDTKCVRIVFDTPYTRYVCNENEELKSKACILTETIKPRY